MYDDGINLKSNDFTVGLTGIGLRRKKIKLQLCEAFLKLAVCIQWENTNDLRTVATSRQNSLSQTCK